MVKRKSPVRHRVRSHTRKGKRIKSFVRGNKQSVRAVKPRKVVRDGSTPIVTEENKVRTVMKYELEKTRNYYGPGGDTKWTTIAEADNEQELVEIAKKTKIRFGKTFEEQLHINVWDDEHVDIIEAIPVRDAIQEHMKKTGKKYYEV